MRLQIKLPQGEDLTFLPWFARLHGYFSSVDVPPVEFLLAEDRLDRGCTLMVISLTAGSFAFLYQSLSFITIGSIKDYLQL